ncbi:MAG: hypothetical protein LBN95_00045 [Prevotellaceae bacterium]|jgi:tetratricopeptide (TPR) repeat protein|nr:hypothetical protein [Prevotellaceae bacterium]
MKKNFFITLILSFFTISAFSQTTLYSQGISLLDEGKNDEAIELFSQSIEYQEVPEWIPYIMRAFAYAELEKFVSAYNDIQKSLQMANANKKRDKESIHSIYAIASDIYKSALDFDNSLKNINLAIKTSPSKEKALGHTISRGNLYFAASLYKASIKDYNTVLKANPKDDATKLALVRSIISEQEKADKTDKKAVEKALNLIDEVLKTDIEYAAAYKFKIRGNLLINNYLQADEDAYMYRSFFKSMYSIEEYEDEFDYAERLLFHCAELDTMAFKNTLLKKIETAPKNPLPYFLFAQYYDKHKNYKEVVNYITKTINNANAELDMLLVERARYYILLKEYDKSLTDLHLSKQMNDTLFYIYFLEGLNFIELDSLNAAVQSYTKYIEYAHDKINAYMCRAGVYKDMKEYELAKIDLDSAYNIDNKDIDLLIGYAELYSEMENRTETNNYYQKILSISDSIANEGYEINTDYLAMIYNNMSYNFVKMGEYEKADELIEKALELNDSSSYYWDTRGELYFWTKEYEKCISDMDKAIELAEKEEKESAGNSYFYRGRAKIELGQTESGNEDIKKAAELKHEEAITMINGK